MTEQGHGNVHERMRNLTFAPLWSSIRENDVKPIRIRARKESPLEQVDRRLKYHIAERVRHEEEIAKLWAKRALLMGGRAQADA